MQSYTPHHDTRTHLEFTARHATSPRQTLTLALQPLLIGTHIHFSDSLDFFDGYTVTPVARSQGVSNLDCFAVNCHRTLTSSTTAHRWICTAHRHTAPRCLRTHLEFTARHATSPRQTLTLALQPLLIGTHIHFSDSLDFFDGYTVTPVARSQGVSNLDCFAVNCHRTLTSSTTAHRWICTAHRHTAPCCLHTTIAPSFALLTGRECCGGHTLGRCVTCIYRFSAKYWLVSRSRLLTKGL